MLEVTEEGNARNDRGDVISTKHHPMSSRLSEAHGEISGDPSTTLGMTGGGGV